MSKTKTNWIQGNNNEQRMQPRMRQTNAKRIDYNQKQNNFPQNQLSKKSDPWQWTPRREKQFYKKGDGLLGDASQQTEEIAVMGRENSEKSIREERPNDEQKRMRKNWNSCRQGTRGQLRKSLRHWARHKKRCQLGDIEHVQTNPNANRLELRAEKSHHLEPLRNSAIQLKWKGISDQKPDTRAQTTHRNKIYGPPSRTPLDESLRHESK